MENASKALIIAGAILLSILIIGLGMFIYQQAAGAMSGAGLDKEKIAAYNSEFEQYEGTQSGTNVRALCDLVRSHNNANVDDTTMQIIIQTSSAAGITNASEDGFTAAAINSIKSNIKAGKTYTIDFGYDAKSGYIVAIGIVEKQ